MIYQFILVTISNNPENRPRETKSSIHAYAKTTDVLGPGGHTSINPNTVELKMKLSFLFLLKETVKSMCVYQQEDGMTKRTSGLQTMLTCKSNSNILIFSFLLSTF